MASSGFVGPLDESTALQSQNHKVQLAVAIRVSSYKSSAIASPNASNHEDDFC